MWVASTFCFEEKHMTTQKLATLAINSRLQPVLVVDPGSHLAVGKIVQGLKRMRSGLWTHHEGDTTLVITPSVGKEHELYKLADSLPERGYLLEETPQHKDLDRVRAERKAKIQERAAQAAIPPMAFAQKRFSFRPHPLGWRVTFATKSSFTAWVNGHNIPFSHLGKHHAIIGHLPQSITPKYDRTPQCTWVSPAPEASAEPAPVERPDHKWTRDQIKSWLNDKGVDTLGITRKAELLELANSI